MATKCWEMYVRLLFRPLMTDDVVDVPLTS